jgi:hypothetical protein
MTSRAVLCVVALALVVAPHARTRAQQHALDVGEDCTLDLGPTPRTTHPAPAPAGPISTGPIPTGSGLGALSFDACAAQLASAGVTFERLDGVAGVAQPIHVRGPVGAGLVVRTQGHEPRPVRSGDAVDHRFDAVFDCRLALALHAWSTDLRAAGYVAIEHVSVLRPRARVAATGRVSGHAHALAIDVLTLVREDGTTFRILDDWLARTRGADPCADFDEPAEQRRVRRLVCTGVARGLFQIAITPHHDDRHANHLHLEVRPSVDWAVIR